MFTLFATSVISTQECPIGLDYKYNTVVNQTVPKGNYTFFLTTHSNDPRPLYIDVKTNGTIHILQSNDTRCPTIEDEQVVYASHNMGKRDKPVRGELHVRSNVGLIVVGAYSPIEDSYFELKLINQNKVVPFWTPFKKLMLVLILMIASVVAFFFYVTNPEPEHEKND